MSDKNISAPVASSAANAGASAKQVVYKTLDGNEAAAYVAYR